MVSKPNIWNNFLERKSSSNHMRIDFCPQQSKARRCVGGRPVRKEREIPAEETAGESRDAVGTWPGKKQEDQRRSPGPRHLKSICPKENGLSKCQEIVKDRRAWHAAVHRISKSWAWRGNWTTTKKIEPILWPYTSSPTCLIHITRPALFTITKTWKQSKRSSTDEWIKKLW